MEHDPHSYAAPLTATTDHISNNHHHLNHSHINSLTSQTFPEIGPTIQNNHGNTQDMHYALQNEADMQTHANGQTYRGYIENNFPMHDAQSSVRHNTTFDFLLDSPAMGLTNMGSPGFITLPSPSSVSSVPGQRQRSAPPCRYPVVAPLIPLIGSFLSQSLACELLDHYFETASHSSSLPTSPYILAFVYRRKSFLDPYKPRWRSPALLASMLYVAAQTSDAPYLSSTPTRRSQICQKLFQIAVFSLRPLIHGSFSTAASQTGPSNLESGFVLGGLVSFDQPGAEKSTHASLDDVATYMHLATVVSASEFKRASLRWWGGAWYLAKELQLGQEVTHDSHAYELYPDMTEDGQGDGKPPVIGEEEREERRRIWWILYIAERHLALCYNSPVMLLDRECQDLIQPLDEEVWQTGAFLHPDFPHASRRRGPPVEFTGSSVFGYVLPLMNILGQIVQLQDMRNQPRFSPALRDPSIWDAHVEDINSQLDAFARSMRTYQALMIDETTTALPPNATPFHPGPAHSSESNMLAKTAVAYATHMMHVLHILVAGKWDPIALFDDADGWISSPSFVTATGHAVGAADALSQVLELDPDLSFMPFLYGIYLLQGSFLLLLLADKLQQDAGAPVVRACETIVRAHEACVVTLSTEYQVSSLSLLASPRCGAEG